MFWQRFFALTLVWGLLIPQSVPVVSAAGYCDWAQFVADVSVPDGSVFPPGTSFTKTWQLKNIGTCTWTTAYTLVFDSGSQMGAPAAINLPAGVAPGQTVDLPVSMTAPSTPGLYRGFWMLNNESGVRFGIGSSANSAFWVEISVPAATAVAYDFVSYAPYAQWYSEAGVLPFPGTSGDYRGYAQVVDFPHLEDGSFESAPGLLTVPQNKYNGYIQAVYPVFAVQKGDRFQADVGCEYGASCYVTFQLNYIAPAGKKWVFWTRREMNDRRIGRVNLDLSPLAGQNVRFVLTLLATGSALGDRPIWGSPRIVRTGAVSPPVPATAVPPPTMTPSLIPFGTLPAIVPSGCDKASFVADVTVPDGTYFTPGAAFSKTWRLKNISSCTWTTDYKAFFYSGEQMNAPTSVGLPRQVAPGATVDLTLNMVAPTGSGLYRGNWVLSNPSGALFGIGPDADRPFWLQINVSGGALAESGYDFAANVCAAQWKSGAGSLPCPGLDSDLKGFALKLDAPRLEDGSVGVMPGLLTAPQFKYNGYIQGIYPTFTVQPGDRFQTTVGCEYGANCFVTFRLDTMTPTGSTGSFWTWREQNEKRFYNADVDLTPLAGQSVRFILTILATGYPYSDRAIWGAPRILRLTSGRPATPTAIASSTPVPTSQVTDWPTYTNYKYGFEFKYPPEGEVTSQQDNYARIALPFIPGTNLIEKYLDVSVVEDAATCMSPFGQGRPPDIFPSTQVVINGITFLKESGEEGAAGQIYQWTAYSTRKDNSCISLGFVLHSSNPGNYSTPPPLFNETTEEAVFPDIVSTLAWLSQTPTSSPEPTPLPTMTPTEVVLMGPYAVTRLGPGQALNIYADAGEANPVAGSFASDATNVMRTGPVGTVEGAQWVEVLLPDGSGNGWVNSYYLTEYVTHEIFCADGRLTPLIEQLKQSMNQSNGELFAPLVSPIHGADVRLWAYQPAINFDPLEARNIFTSAESYNWGSGPRGEPDIGTFAEIIQQKLQEVLNAGNLEVYCDDLTKVYPLSNPWPLTYHGVHFYNLYKPATPGIDFDFRTWLIGFEYINGQPYLYGMVTIVWEP